MKVTQEVCNETTVVRKSVKGSKIPALLLTHCVVLGKPQRAIL